MATKLTKLTQNNHTAAPNGREMCHLQFSLQPASPETFGYTLVDEATDVVKDAHLITCVRYMFANDMENLLFCKPIDGRSL
jgi:hypothetical protein